MEVLGARLGMWGLNQAVAGVEQLGAPVDDELGAGEISIHSDLLVHGSEANRSDRRRCGLTLRYCPAEVRAELGWNASDRKRERPRGSLGKPAAVGRRLRAAGGAMR
jgi:hypothetical protein